MKKELTALYLIISALSATIPAAADILSLGNEDGWNGTRTVNLETTPGRGGFLDLIIHTSELRTDSEDTDLLLPFNKPESFDRTGQYRILRNPDYSDRYFKSGTGSATFENKEGMILSSLEGSLLSPYTLWEDFTIEFWLYPANPREGEQILQWKGLGRTDDQIYSQSIQAHFINRKMVWSFENFFQLPETPYSHFEISGDPVLPRTWHHHMLRYDSQSGLLEYLIDGIPSAIIHTTDSGNESHKVYTPRIGVDPGNLQIGIGLTGFMDEFRIEKRLVVNRSLNRYYQPGYGISAIQDLTYPDSQLKDLRSVHSTPGNSEVFSFYYLTNDLLEAEQVHGSFRGEQTILENPEIWRSFQDLDADSTGRYLIMAFLLYPDLKTDQSPGISSLEAEYVPSLPPLPPSNIRVSRDSSGSVRLNWKSSPSPDVRGYLVYYGEKPGEYIYPGSPMKTENGDYTVIEGLDPFKQYFFSIKSYSGEESPQYSDFSEEISMRP